MAGQEQGKKRLNPGEDNWFVLFLCSRWGKTKSEIEQIPVTEFEEHKWFWDNYRWGMQDDLLSIGITNHMKASAPNSKVQPWMVKMWTVQKGYTYRVTHVFAKPVAAIRSGFMNIFNMLKAKLNGR